MATIKDIASKTGLSLGTISKYLNGKNVLPENAALIQEAINELHYQVNPFARGLKTSRSLTIGFLTHHWESNFFMRVVSVIENTLHEYGYGVIVCAYNGNEEQEKEKFSMLAQRVDAIVIQPYHIDGKFISETLTHSIPIISIDRPLSDFNCDNILVNNLNSSYAAIESLIQAGHRRIALLTGTKDLYTTQNRVTAFQRVFEDYDLSYDENLICFGDFHQSTGFEITSRLLKLKKPPTAIYATTNEMTLGALAAFDKFDISVPDSLSFIGSDIISQAGVYAKHYAQVYQPVDAFGKAVSEVLIKRLFEETPSPFKTLRLKSEFYYRESIKTINE